MEDNNNNKDDDRTLTFNLVQAKSFNVNDGIPEKVIGPQSNQICRLPNPQGTVYSVEDYASLWSSVGPKSMVALIKDFGASLPPYTQSFGKISYMPGNSTSQLGVLQWPGLPPETLQKLAKEMIGPNMILAQRRLDIIRYSEYSRHPWKPGWRIVPEDDPDGELDAATKKDILEARQFIENCGYGDMYADPLTRDRLLRTSFSKFLVEALMDSYTYDGIAVWTDVNPRGDIQSFTLIPAGKIRLLARPDQTQFRAIQQGELDFYGATNFSGKRPEVDPKDPPFAVTVDETTNIVKPFTRKELVWYTRNSRDDAEIGGYGHPEMEVGLTLLTGFNNAIQFNCFSEDTEVLTKTGWKLFSDVDIEIDDIATINTSNSEFEWQKAYRKFWQPYEGEMYHINARSVDLLVTPNHNTLLIKNDRKTPSHLKNTYNSNGNKVGRPICDSIYKTIQTDKLFKEMGDKKLSTYCHIPVTSKWKGTEIQDKIFSKSVKMTGDEYCAFMGMYLSEGSVGFQIKENERYYTSILIYQFSKSKGFVLYNELIEKITGESAKYSDDRYFSIHNVDLAKYLAQFGSTASIKTIPQDILDATPKQLRIFWDYFEAGDGYSRQTNKGNYKTEKRGRLNGVSHKIGTTSYTMASQFQEIALKMGYSGTLWTDHKRVDLPERTFIDSHGTEKTIKTQLPYFEVYLNGTPSHAFKIKKIDHYKGFIGCLTVPNHTVYVRRNGKVAYSKQSDLFDKNSIPKGILCIKGNWSQRQFDALGRIWDNLQRGHRTDWTLPAVQMSEKGAIEVINLEPLRKEPVYYNNLINLFMGALCTLYGIPPHRIGYKISGTSRDSKPDSPKNVELEEDVGMPGILTHFELLINPYILKNRFPHLRLEFTGKSPKEDARLYEISLNTKTVDERRKLVGDPPLIDTLPKGASKSRKWLMKMMGDAPADPALTAVYQSGVAALAKAGALNDELGIPMPMGGGMGGGGTGQSGLGDVPGSNFGHKKDPSEASAHGGQSGVRRDSRQEKHKGPSSTVKKPPSPGGWGGESQKRQE